MWLAQIWSCIKPWVWVWLWLDHRWYVGMWPTGRHVNKCDCSIKQLMYDVLEKHIQLDIVPGWRCQCPHSSHLSRWHTNTPHTPVRSSNMTLFNFLSTFITNKLFDNTRFLSGLSGMYLLPRHQTRARIVCGYNMSLICRIIKVMDVKKTAI